LTSAELLNLWSEPNDCGLKLVYTLPKTIENDLVLSSQFDLSLSGFLFSWFGLSL